MSEVGLTYKGGAFDYDSEPQVYAKDSVSGKPDDSRILKTMKLIPKPLLAAYRLWRREFPLDVEVVLTKEDCPPGKPDLGLWARKATGLGCFTVRCDPSLLVEPPKQRRR